MPRKTASLAIGLAALATASTAHGEAPDLWTTFLHPPAEARPMVRWWWFGPAVEDKEIDREIAAMKAGGFGGFEVQPTYPLSPDDPAHGLNNLPYLSDAFIARLAHAGETARREGMRIDVTIGSGWPFGGPHVPVTQAASMIRMVSVDLPRNQTSACAPAPQAGEQLLAAYADGQRIGLTDGCASLPGNSSLRQITFAIASRTGQQVKRAAVGAEGFVIDHVDASAVQHHLAVVGGRLLQAFPKDQPPYAMFSDSLEAYGSNWTGDLPQQFRQRRGYDLLDHIPALIHQGPESEAVRYDWARTLSELVDERYLSPITAWAQNHNTRFRAQVYGFPPPTLSSNALVTLPEGEGADWRSFTSTRWATSAAHLYGRPVVSSEVWTWLHSPTWAATPLDMKIEADRHFLQGINQLVGHGWPYTPPGLPEPGWAFYAASSLNDHNPWYPAMPAVTAYLTRVSALLRAGEVNNKVAIYLPTEDVFAAMSPDYASADKAMKVHVPGSLVGAVLDAGFGFDFIDATAIRKGRLKAQVLILPPMKRIDPEAFQAIQHWTRAGGKVIALDHLPSVGGGLLDQAGATALVRKVGQDLGKAMRVVPDVQLGNALRDLATPDISLPRPEPALGVVRRKVDGGYLYFLVNTGPHSLETSVHFAEDGEGGALWNPMTGERQGVSPGPVALRLEPYESRVLMLGKAFTAPVVRQREVRPILDLSANWTLALPVRQEILPRIAPWTDNPEDIHLSGAAHYRRSFTLQSLPEGHAFMLDLGSPQSLDQPQGMPARPQAEIAAPVREAAIVRINGEEVGTLWAPPYRLDITRALHKGRNEIDIMVMNGAVNALAGHAPADRRLLTLRYGERFQDQDQDRILPQPSGLSGPITLLSD
ncbi:glycosyl hydrolase [Novosphingobium terrae]|uniref:glycosyl hydrolase n=1 Tax=Novosphingobium terrae TaxID=2726189 RepID=UPI001981527C|nr:glycosyl hydrolase [Novosphingobium terrae]